MWKITNSILTIASPIVGVLSLLFGDNLIARWHLNWLPYFLFGVGFAWGVSWLVDLRYELQALTPDAKRLLKAAETCDRIDVGRDYVKIGNVKTTIHPLAVKELLDLKYIVKIGTDDGDWRFCAYKISGKGLTFYRYAKIVRAFK